MALTDAEKERARYHLGYPNVNALAGLAFGIPKQQQTLFLVETALQQIMAVAEPRVRSILGVLDGLDCQIIQAQQYLVASKLDEMVLRDNHPDLLEREYCRWAQRLSDLIGAPLYPFAARFKSAPGVLAGSIPVRR